MIRTITQKLVLLVAVLLCQSTLASAATADITIDDIQMSTGWNNEYTVEVKLTSSELIINPQFDIKLPNGIRMSGNPTKGDLLTRNHTMSYAQQSDGSYRFVIVSTTNKAVTATEGVLVKFNIIANTSVNDKIKVFNKSLILDSDNSVQLKPADTESSIVASAGLYGDVTFGVSPTAIDVTPGTPFSVAVDMTNSIDQIVAFEAKLQLPAGVSLVETADGNIGYTDRIPDGVTIDATKLADGSYKILMSSLTNTPVEGTSGTLFTIDMNADETLAATADVVLSDIVVAAVNGAGKMLTDVFTIKLTNTAIAAEEAAKAAALQALADMQQALDNAVAAIPTTYPAAANNAEVDALRQAAQQIIDNLTAEVNGGNYANVETQKAALQQAISAMNAKAAEIQNAADQAAADEAAKNAALQEIAAMQQSLDNAVAAIPTTYPAAANNAEVDALRQAAQQIIDNLTAEVNGGNYANVETQKAALAQAISAMNAKAAEIQAAADQAAADEAAAKAAAQQILANMQQALANANMKIATDYPAAYNDTEVEALRQAAQQIIDNFAAEIAAGNYANTAAQQTALQNAIAALMVKAAEVQAAADQAAADEAAAKAAAQQALANMQQALDNANTKITIDYPAAVNDAEVEALRQAAQQIIDDLTAEVEAGNYANVTTAQAALQNAIAALLAKAAEVQEASSTGISAANATNVSCKNSIYYNLNGQRVATPAKGLVIMNGKKIVVK